MVSPDLSIKLVTPHHEEQDLAFSGRRFLPSTPILCHTDPMASLKSSKKTTYDYQKQLVWCTCSECTASFGPKGQQIKQYTRRKHIEKDKMAALRDKTRRPELPVVPFNETIAFKKARLDQSVAVAGPSGYTESQLVEPIGDDEGEFDMPGSEAEQPIASSIIPHALPTPPSPPPDFDDFYMDPPDNFDIPDDNVSITGAEQSARDAHEAMDTSETTPPPQPPSPTPAAAIPHNPTAPSSSEAPEVVLEPPPPPNEVFQESSPFWFWRIILVLAAWLHLHYHVPHRACTLFLKVLRTLLIGLGHITRNDKVPITLSTTFRRLRLNDEFRVYPTCPRCHEIYPVDSPTSMQCDKCSIALFKFYEAPNPEEGASGKTRTKPVLQCPLQPISEQLPQLLNRYGVEAMCDAWRGQETKPGYMLSIMDGEIWKTLKGHDGKPFFDNSIDRDNPEELRLGITLGFDG